MKKFIALLTTISIIFSSNICTTKIINAQSNDSKQITQEQDYVKELERIQDQLSIISSQSLKSMIDKKDTSNILKEINFIKTQIRELKDPLSDYYAKTNSDLVKSSISLGLLNTLNYYSMALSYLQVFLSSSDSSIQVDNLENYFFNKKMGDETLNWVVEETK